MRIFLWDRVSGHTEFCGTHAFEEPHTETHAVDMKFAWDLLDPWTLATALVMGLWLVMTLVRVARRA